MNSSGVSEIVTRFLSYVNGSPSPFHAVRNAASRLEAAGFKKIREREDWEKDIRPGEKYYFTRNQSSLLAFTIPKGWSHGAGVSIVATHVDSPNLRVRPISKRSKLGYLQVAIELYGGGIWHSWLDRDLSLAGRVIVQDKHGGFISKLVHVKRPLLRIPTLAIHLDRDVNKNFQMNLESEFIPILGQVSSKLNSPPKTEDEDGEDEPTAAFSAQERHHPALLLVLSEELSVAPEDIHDFELCLYDTQPGVTGGIDNEFIFGARMDNLFSSFCAVEAMVNYASSQAFQTNIGNVNCISLFNHEEIGSISTTGAGSSLIPTLLERLSPTPATYAQSVARSFLISADVAHAVHPNYSSKHEVNHRPRINGGVVIKTNANQRYASDSIGRCIIKRLAERVGGKTQEFEIRNDMPCGSTVGPTLSKLGVATVDVGTAILSMHSIRETAGSHDVQKEIDLFTSFFEAFTEVEHVLQVD